MVHGASKVPAPSDGAVVLPAGLVKFDAKAGLAAHIVLAHETNRSQAAVVPGKVCCVGIGRTNRWSTHSRRKSQHGMLGRAARDRSQPLERRNLSCTVCAGNLQRRNEMMPPSPYPSCH